MRQVYPRDMVAHLWANHSQESARTAGAGNFFFNGEAIFSYRLSYAVAAFSPWIDAQGRRIVIMRETPYGNTTGRHFSAVTQALSGHPVNVLRIDPLHNNSRDYSDMQDTQARGIARGELYMARGIIGACVEHANAAALAALPRVAPHSIAWQYHKAADYLAIALCIARASEAGLKGKAKRDHARACSAILAAAPTLPAGFLNYAIAELGAPDYPSWRDPDREAKQAARDAAMPEPLENREALARELWAEQRAAKREADRDARLQRHVDNAKASETQARAATTATGKRSAWQRAEQEWRVAGTLAKKQKRPADYRAKLAKNETACEARAARLFADATLQEAGNALASIARNRDGLARRMAKGARGNGQTVRLSTGKAWRRSETLPDAWRDALEPAYQFANMCDALADVAICASAPRGQRAEAASRVMHARKERGIVAYTDTARVVADLARVADRKPEALALLLDISRAADAGRVEARAAIHKIKGRKVAALVRDNAREMMRLAADFTPENADTTSRRLQSAIQHCPIADRTDRPDVARAVEAAVGFPGIPAMRETLAKADAYCFYAAAASSLQACGQGTARALDHVKAARDKMGARLPLDAETSAGRAVTEATQAGARIAGIEREARDAAANVALPADLRTLWHALFERAHAMVPHAAAAVLDAQAVAADAAHAAGEARSNLVQHWRETGEGAHLLPRGSAYFRRGRSGIVSSLGAEVSEEAGRRLWALIRACVASGRDRTWPYGEGPHVGSFRVTSITAAGSAVVGCHSIGGSEARAFARYMQWPPFGAETAADVAP